MREVARAMRRSAPEPALDAGGKRIDIAEKTGVVVGVANASLSVERGAISVLMGLSGSGKSTLLRAANGLNRVTRGQGLVGDGGTPVDIGVNCDPATLRRIRSSWSACRNGVSATAASSPAACSSAWDWHAPLPP